jgi:hypothetical protein
MKKLYKYTLTEDFKKFYPQLANVSFMRYWKDSKGQLLYVHIENGFVTISKGYSYDGCTPKFAKVKYKGKDVYIGTPDGLHDELKWASLIHDCLYQFNIGTFRTANTIFFNEMELVNWKYSELYYAAVSTIGWFWWIT